MARKGMIARILILFLTAFISMGFIYTMLYKGTVYEALFGNQGFFSKYENVSQTSDKTPDRTGKSTPQAAISPEPTAGATNEPATNETATEESDTTATLEPTPTPSPGPSPTFEPLKPGMRSPKVRELQTLLAVKGYYKHNEFTDYFGPITENAVKEFQKKNGLPVTGIVDEVTMEKLKAAKDVM